MATTIYNAWICQIDEKRVAPVYGNVRVENGIIAAIEPRPFRQVAGTIGDTDIDAAGRMLTVPMVNVHDHFYSRLAKGLQIDDPLNSFIDILTHLWWKLDRLLTTPMIRASVQMALCESVRCGVTYVFDHHSSPNALDGVLSLIGDEMVRFGIRGVLCVEVSDRDGVKKSAAGLRETERFLSTGQTDDVPGMQGLHASFTLSDDTLQQASAFVRMYQTGIHIHVGEDSYDNTESRRVFGKSPVARLDQYDLLTPKGIVAHALHLDTGDYRLLQERGTGIVVNPDSNMNNAVGLPDFARIPEEIPLLAGTDGMHANIARTWKQLFLLHRHQQFSFADTFRRMTKIYFDQLCFVKRYFPDFPHLQVGDRADCILWDYAPPNELSVNNFWGHFIYGALESPVRTVLQGGTLLMHDFQLISVQEADIRQNIVTQGQKLAQLFSECL